MYFQCCSPTALRQVQLPAHPYAWPPALPTHPPPSRPKDKVEVAVCPPPHLLPGNVFGWVSEGKRGPHGHPQRSRQDQIQSARGGTWLCLSPNSSRDQLWSEWVGLGDAAAINMRQRVRVSDSCTVEQGHAVLALGEALQKRQTQCGGTSWYVFMHLSSWCMIRWKL